MRIHVVKKGDTLWKIAKQYGVDFEELKRINSHLSNPDYILPGMEIYLPNPSSNQKPSSAQTQSGSNMGSNPNQNNQISNQQRSSKEELTKSIEDFILPQEALPSISSKKEQLTAPTQQKPSTKEKLTQPIKEVKPPKEVETAPKPVEMKPPIIPQLHFDFAPQFHHQPVQPQPQPMPMPQPQPIFIEMPQAQQPIYIEMPQQPQQVEHVKEKEYIPIQQPHYVYIPYFLGYVPCPEPMHVDPCDCHHHVEYHPCPCENVHPQNVYPHYEVHPPMSPYSSEYFTDSSEYVAPQIDLKKIEEGLPDWLERESTSSSSRRKTKSTHEKGNVAKHYIESSSSGKHHGMKRQKHRSDSFPYLNPNPYSPWNF